MSLTFRFDDVCIASNMEHTNGIARILRTKFPDCKIIYAISPAVRASHDERVFPKIWNAYSNHQQYYQMNKIGIPNTPDYVTKASHAMVHCDHRLMDRGAQELSILLSCSLIGTNIFVPPFNKYNKDTEDICKENGIELVKFSDGWLCLEYEDYDPEINLWYLHAREVSLKKLTEWLNV